MAESITYDTGEIRRAARQIRNCADQLEDSAEPKLRRIQSELPESFEGKAADALEERISDISADVKAIGKSLNSLYKALSRYADALDEADRRMADSF